MKNLFFVISIFVSSFTIIAQNSVKVVAPTPTEAKIGETIPVTIEYTAEKPVKFLVQINKIGWGLTPAFVRSKQKFSSGKNKTATIELKIKAKDGAKIVDPRLKYAFTVRMFKYKSDMEDKNTIAAEYQKYEVDILSESGKGKKRRKIRRLN